MKPAHPTSQQGSRLDGIATRWSMVQTAHAAGDPTDAIAARQALVLRYARAVRRYVGGMVRDGGDADELAQEVIVRLMKGDFCGADPNRGRFRDLLKTVVRNMVHGHWAKLNRRKLVAADLALIAAAEEPDPVWDAEWRQSVLDHAWASLKEHERANPTPPTYTVLQLRTVHPDATIEHLAGLLAAKVGTVIRADVCRQWLRRARLRFAAAIVDELRAGLTDPTPARLADDLAALGLLEYVKGYMPQE